MLHREGRLFIWWVDAADGPEKVLHVIADDKRFHVQYPLEQPAEEGVLAVHGREFPGLPDAGSGWIRVRVPTWDSTAVGPGFVRRLIDWALTPDKPLLRVDWRGKPKEGDDAPSIDLPDIIQRPLHRTRR
ncbi:MULTISPECIES: hypothetical protein [Myxococcus]|nr:MULTISPECIES: hypothetical protein [Myxococcus]NOJ54927.1 hypothetical protein [Myxococcus xanthus]QPM79659.1 hypothetical protein I5Q59_36525 [Myxococcus xanthus]QVW68739.1 hypothetical protein JTM82_04055 [Myxococcus xanthus DZ2]UEO05148.1 hypothetical protein K1515_00925 [Myxococcus xanthus DZ2]UYI14639.1 hypothetical protein N3T43_37205 [Myxococcus xanthus]